MVEKGEKPPPYLTSNENIILLKRSASIPGPVVFTYHAWAKRGYSPKSLEGEFSEVGLGRGETLRGLFATSSAVPASPHPGAALPATPGGRVVLGVIVERPVALRAGLEAGPGPALLSSEHDRGQPADGVVQPARVGREQI